MSFTVIQNKTKLIYRFEEPDKLMTILKIFGLVVLYFFGFLSQFGEKNLNFNSVFFYSVLLVSFIYYTLVPYFEWKKNGRRLITKKNNFLYINAKRIINLKEDQVIKVVAYSDKSSESHDFYYLVYLGFDYHDTVLLKKRLSQEEALDFSDEIARFFEVVVIKAN